MNETRELALIADGARMLAEARGLFEVRDVRSVAIAAVAYARAKDLGEDAIRSANRIVILATARIGEEIVAGQERGEIAVPHRHVSDVDDDDIRPATLRDLGISRDLSAKAQRLAQEPEKVRVYLDTAADPTLAGAVRAAEPAATARDPLPMNDVHRAKYPELAYTELRAELTADMYAFAKATAWRPETWADRMDQFRTAELAAIRQQITWIRLRLDAWEALLERPALSVVGEPR